jgi:hypothetical protein
MRMMRMKAAIATPATIKVVRWLWESRSWVGWLDMVGVGWLIAVEEEWLVGVEEGWLVGVEEEWSDGRGGSRLGGVGVAAVRVIWRRRERPRR